jgi:hypothetical protein
MDRGYARMQIENFQDLENFWIQVVEGAVKAGNTVTCVPVDCLGRRTAARLAARLQIMVFIKGNDYLFTNSLQELLQDDRNLH